MYFGMWVSVEKRTFQPTIYDTQTIFSNLYNSDNINWDYVPLCQEKDNKSIVFTIHH